METEQHYPALDLWNSMLSPAHSPLPMKAPGHVGPFPGQQYLHSTTRSALGKRKENDGQRLANPVNRGGSHYRGVTHHARTNRYESHIWDEGRQLYLGGFYTEGQAALAYDLAAIRFRGEEATTNFDARRYDAEMAERQRYTREQIVSCLRDQSKTMNKVIPDAGPAVMEPWEVAISAALHPNKVHIGVFSSEIEAARAYDRGLIMSLGIEAAPLLNFELVNYLDALTQGQADAAVRQGLLPYDIPASFTLPPCPQPLFQVDCSLPIAPLPQFILPTSLQGNTIQGIINGSSLDFELPADFSPPQTGDASPPVTRRKSTTPRSVLEFDDNFIANLMHFDDHQAGVQQVVAPPGGATATVAVTGDGQSKAKRQKVDQTELPKWINELAL